MLSLEVSGGSHRRAFPAAPAIDLRKCSGRDFDQGILQSSVRCFETKEFIFLEGDPATHVYRLESGAVSLFKVLPDGRRQILGFAYAGDFIGLGHANEHIMNAQAIQSTRIRSIPLAKLHQIAAKDASVSFMLYQAISEELATMRDLMMTTGHRSACERVVTFLLALWRRKERQGHLKATIDLPMTRADIADFLGLTIETVSRTLTKLKTRGLIDLPQSTCVDLLDINELQRLAEGADGW